MGRTKAKLVRVKRRRIVIDDEGNVVKDEEGNTKFVDAGYEMISQKVPFTEEEEAARDVEEATWNAKAPERERTQLVETEILALQQEEQADLKQRAETRLKQRGEIT